MKRILPLFIILIVVALVGGTFWFLYNKSKTKAVVFTTETAQVTDIVQKTVATGAIVPRQEVELKPRVSGVIEELFVLAGAEVKRGAPIAKVQIVPDAASLARGEGSVRTAKIALDNAKRELTRNEGLYRQGVIAEAELASIRTTYELRKAEFDDAGSSLQIVKEGQLRGAKKESNIIVTSTVDGMVIDVPVELGVSVTESNTFNAGTTVAVVADMNDMIFEGQVDESEVGKIKVGMPLRIKIGALEKEQFEGTLEYIAPKGIEVDGAIQFQIKAALTRREGVFIRAGYSANADVVLAERKQVLAIREALVQTADGKAFIEVAAGKGQFSRRDVVLGMSDGVMVEVVSGVAATDAIKVPSNAGPGRSGGPGGGRRPRM